MRRNENISSEILRPRNVIELPIEASLELAVIALTSVLSAFEVNYIQFNIIYLILLFHFYYRKQIKIF